jgi:hypothetical protein
MSDRVTRELTPYLEIMKGPSPIRTRVLCQFEDAEVLEENGRAILKTHAKKGDAIRFLLDPDADFYALLCGTSRASLERAFEAHVEQLDEVPEELEGLTLVTADAGVDVSAERNFRVAFKVPPGAKDVSRGADEVHVCLKPDTDPPAEWPDVDVPLALVVRLDDPTGLSVLSPVAHGMGTGRIPVREIRIRINPSVYLAKKRRSPFLSEMTEAIASVVGCDPVSLMREMALRGRLAEKGMRRHLLPDPAFVTFVFRGHRVRGLVAATDHFPVPRRASRQEILRGTPASERERLIQYLNLVEDTRPRLQAFEHSDLFAISVHFLPNPEVPLPSPHGGITRWTGKELLPLQG